MSRTYRKMRISKNNSAKMYYSGCRWPEVGVISTERVRKLYREWKNVPSRVWDGTYIRSSLRHVDMSWVAEQVHEHVFRNRSSYRQRINGIRLSKRLDNKVARAKLKEDLRARVKYADEETDY